MPQNPPVISPRRLTTPLILGLLCLTPTLQAANGYGVYRDDPTISGPYQSAQPRYSDGGYSHSTFTDMGNRGTEWGSRSTYRPLNESQRPSSRYRQESYGSQPRNIYRDNAAYPGGAPFTGSLPGLGGLGAYPGTSLLSDSLIYGLTPSRLYPDLLSTPLGTPLGKGLYDLPRPEAGRYQAPSRLTDPKQLISEAYERGLRDAQRSQDDHYRAREAYPQVPYAPGRDVQQPDYPKRTFPQSEFRGDHSGHASPGRDRGAPYRGFTPSPDAGYGLPEQPTFAPAHSPDGAPYPNNPAQPHLGRARPDSMPQNWQQPQQIHLQTSVQDRSAGHQFRPWTPAEQEEIGQSRSGAPANRSFMTVSPPAVVKDTPLGRTGLPNTPPPFPEPAYQSNVSERAQDTPDFRPLDLPAYDDRDRPPRPNRLTAEEASRFEPPITDKAQDWSDFNQTQSRSQGLALPQDMEQRLKNSVREFEMRFPQDQRSSHQQQNPLQGRQKQHQLSWESPETSSTEAPRLIDSLLGQSNSSQTPPSTGSPSLVPPSGLQSQAQGKNTSPGPKQDAVAQPQIDEAIRIAPVEAQTQPPAVHRERPPSADTVPIDSLLPAPSLDPQPWLDIQIMDVVPNQAQSNTEQSEKGAVKTDTHTPIEQPSEQHTDVAPKSVSKPQAVPVVTARPEVNVGPDQVSDAEVPVLAPDPEASTSLPKPPAPATGFGNVKPRTPKNLEVTDPEPFPTSTPTEASAQTAPQSPTHNNMEETPPAASTTIPDAPSSVKPPPQDIPLQLPPRADSDTND